MMMTTKNSIPAKQSSSIDANCQFRNKLSNHSHTIAKKTYVFKLNDSVSICAFFTKNNLLIAGLVGDRE